MNVKYLVLKTISKTSRIKIRHLIYRLKSFLVFYNLEKIGGIHRTDKVGVHSYLKHYQNHFKSKRFDKNKIFEIGVGGYDDPLLGGNSLRMWKSYFPFSKIYSLDIFDKSFHQEKRIKIYKGSQTDLDVLRKITDDVGLFDIIIDDGSHMNEHVLESFKFLFPKLKKNGIYVIEDTQTSYWEIYGGTSNNFNQDGTIYHFFKGLIDSMNNEEFILEDYEKNYYDKHIVSMHFYHNMIFIYKGENDELSNKIVNNKVNRPLL